jgi:hypothetical protein
VRLFAIVSVFVVFTAYTVAVMVGHGVLGFLTLAAREPWALQLLVDLLVMLCLFAFWVWRDSRERRLPTWPYVALTLVMGSMGALLYLVHREIASRRTPRSAARSSVE